MTATPRKRQGWKSPGLKFIITRLLVLWSSFLGKRRSCQFCKGKKKVCFFFFHVKITVCIELIMMRKRRNSEFKFTNKRCKGTPFWKNFCLKDREFLCVAVLSFRGNRWFFWSWFFVFFFWVKLAYLATIILVEKVNFMGLNYYGWFSR